MQTLKKLLMSLSLLLSVMSCSYADVRVGVVFFYPPFVMSASQGFDIDFIQTLCQKTNNKCQLSLMPFEQLFLALDTGQIDVAIGGIVISPARMQHYIFTMPYMLSRGQFVVLKDSTVSSLLDLQGQKVGVIAAEQNGGVFYQYLQTNYPNQFQVKQYANLSDIFSALANREIAAVFTHESTAIYWELNGGNLLRSLGKPAVIGEGMGIMALPEKSALIQQFNQQILELENNGGYLNLYRTYFGSEQ